jgi:hypothetical protein
MITRGGTSRFIIKEALLIRLTVLIASRISRAIGVLPAPSFDEAKGDDAHKL